MTIIFEDQLDRLDKLTGGEISEISKARAEVLEPAFDSYLKSVNLRENAPPPSLLQLVASSDIAVQLSRCKKSGAATDLAITRKSDALDDNFMGYCEEYKCVIFKGEAGLLDNFLDVVESAAAKLEINNTTAVLKAPDQIRIPFGGLEYGLKYEEFVDRVEVLQCAMWIRTSPSEQEKGGKSFVEIAIDSRTPPPSTPEYVPESPDALMAFKASLEDQDVPTRSLSDSDSPLSSCGSSISTPPLLEDSGSDSSHDSSELSDPPAVIYTPPWLRNIDE
ncbi:hypothetical protein FVEN_g11017 [Fusarium venenatum]|uniref:uncharacterized protein n=1 Tax=Fusarium venenatum TaxID=56646 RepID=UPI001D3519DC|nr:hypothetical protein FVEN_g11017 [Fusarium venenatum]KAH7003340.1 hypothetical protein EDB82DRAFT_483401 [Fusarium venenatum]